MGILTLLVLNAGSSTLKASLFSFGEQASGQFTEPIWQALADWNSGQLTVNTPTIRAHFPLPLGDLPQAIGQIFERLCHGEAAVLDTWSQISGVGHRVVHGGCQYSQPIRMTPAVKEAIAQLRDLAPAHNPANLAGIEWAERLLGPQVPQIAVFDTAFHRNLPAAAFTYPGPAAWLEKGWRRYGFHGISHQYCAERLAQLLDRPLSDLQLITCHLGNGCSLAAIRQGQSVDTTMGFTPLEGLMMGTRSGSIDPGLLLHLLRYEGQTADQLDQVLNRESGLLGLSGISADLRQVRAAIEAGQAQAQLALDVFIHRLRQGIGAMLASLDRLDALVFTAGMGENTPLIWQRACEPLGGLRFELLPQLARSPQDQCITQPSSLPSVWVIHTREEWAIARQCWQLLQADPYCG
jgi:acetate kinase